MLPDGSPQVPDERFMSTRPNKFSQSQANRLVKAAAKAGVNMRLEFRPDGTIIAITGRVATPPMHEDADTELDKWMKKHHASPT
jgi:hypothetical protein